MAERVRGPKSQSTPAPDFPTGLRTRDGLFVTDTRQRIRQWSASAEKILGHTAGEVLGRHCYDVFVGRDFQGHPFCRAECPVARNSRRGRPVKDYDIAVEAKDGRRVRVNNSVLLWPGAGGSSAVVHLFREIREKRNKSVSGRTAAGEGQADSTAGSRLSRREMSVLRLLAGGPPTTEIADTLGVSYYTARNQISSIMRKLDARNRLEAVARASALGLI